MAHRKSGFTRRGGRMVRESLWVAILPTVSALGSASTAALFTGFSAAILALRPFTIVRTRGYIHLQSDQEAADETYFATLGAAVVSDQALAIGVTAVPTPQTDADSDLWFLYESLAGTVRFTSASGVFDAGHGRVFDSKSMRKVEDGEDVAMSVETAAISAGAVFLKGGRMLIKLH